MTKHQFMTGIGVGLAAGTALGMMMTAGKKKEIRRAADRAVKAVGEVIENISDNIGL